MIAVALWEKQKEFTDPTWYWVHDTGFYTAQKTAAGDWAAGWTPEGDPCMTDETHDFFETLRKAQKYCEGLTCHLPTQEKTCVQ